MLIITCPLMVIIATALWWEGSGPVLERRECVGRRGHFQLLKFRTTKHDPRHATPARARQTTRLGEYLRYTRIEDLPQLINVLHGEMSIIDRNRRSPSFLD
jgi:lipopolysaccharide/colanic/teichoic acid biosynthesis glycosyltransferase